jgi:hypothetical protein
MRQTILLAALLLAGCAATYPYTRNPSLEREAWTRDVYGCKAQARSGDFVIVGHLLFLAAELQARWKICMVERGWFIPRPKDKETPVARTPPPSRPPVQITTREEYCGQLGEVAWGYGTNRDAGIPLKTVMDGITNLPMIKHEVPGYRDAYRRIAMLVYTTPATLPEELWRRVETACLQEGGTRS